MVLDNRRTNTTANCECLMMLTRIRPYEMADAVASPDIFRAAVHAVGARDYAAEQVEAWTALAPSVTDVTRMAGDGRSLWIAADAKDRPL